MPRLSEADRTLLAQIRRRPAYHLTCIFLEKNAREPDGSPRTCADVPPTIYVEWPLVAWFAHVLGGVYRAHISEETALVALSDNGFEVKRRRGGRFITDLDERIVLDLITQRQDGGALPADRLAHLGDPGEPAR